ASKNGRLVEPPALEALVALGDPAPDGHAGPLLLGDVHVFGHLLPSLLVDERADLALVFETGTEAQFLRPVAHHLQEAVVDLVLEDQAAGGRAALSRRPERPPQH